MDKKMFDDMKKLYDEMVEEEKKRKERDIIWGVLPDTFSYDMIMVDKRLSKLFLRYINFVKDINDPEKNSLKFQPYTGYVEGKEYKPMVLTEKFLFSDYKLPKNNIKPECD